MASAQVKSAILLASLYAQRGRQLIHDLKEREIIPSGCCLILVVRFILKMELFSSLRTITNSERYDYSRRYFFCCFLIVAALIAKNSQISLCNIGINPTRSDVLKILELMASEIELQSSDNSNMSQSYDYYPFKRN